jgi:hypothetical protein
MRQQEDDHGHCSQVEEAKGSRCREEDEEGRRRCDEAGGGDWRSQGQTPGCSQEGCRQKGNAKDDPQNDGTQRHRPQDDGAQGHEEGGRQEGNLREEGCRQEARGEETGGATGSSRVAAGSAFPDAAARTAGFCVDRWSRGRWCVAAAGADLFTFARCSPSTVRSGRIRRVGRREEGLRLGYTEPANAVG